MRLIEKGGVHCTVSKEIKFAKFWISVYMYTTDTI